MVYIHWLRLAFCVTIFLATSCHAGVAHADYVRYRPVVPDSFPLTLKTGYANVYIRGSFDSADGTIPISIAFSNSEGFPLEIQMTHLKDTNLANASIVSCLEDDPGHDDQEGFRCRTNITELRPVSLPIWIGYSSSYLIDICIRKHFAVASISGVQFFSDDLHYNTSLPIDKLWMDGLFDVAEVEIENLDPKQARQCQSD